MASSEQQATLELDKPNMSPPIQGQDSISGHAEENGEELSEEYKALHTGAIYKGKPPYMDSKGANGKPFGPPPIQEWADKLIDKRLIAKDEIGDETVCSCAASYHSHYNPFSTALPPVLYFGRVPYHCLRASYTFLSYSHISNTDVQMFRPTRGHNNSPWFIGLFLSKTKV